MTHNFIEPRTKNISRDIDFWNSLEIYLTNWGNTSWILLLKQDQIALTANWKKWLIKHLKQQVNLQETKSLTKMCNQNSCVRGNSGDVEEIIIPPEKREKKFNGLRKIL